MKAFAHKMKTIIGVNYANMIEYRAEMVLWCLGTVLPIILMGVWMTVAANADMGTKPSEMARYFFATFCVRNLTLAWVVWEFEQQIVQGKLSHWLLQPMDPGWRHLAEHIAERFVRIPTLILMGILFFSLYPKAFWVPSLGQFAIAVGVIILTFLLRFIVQYTFAMLAFWTERAHAIEQFWALPYMFLSGMVAPLWLYPETLQKLLIYLPFPYLIGFPAMMLMGKPYEAAGQPVSVLFAISVMLAWSALFFILNRILWHIGVKRYSAMGA